jgi:hypothetical protein
MEIEASDYDGIEARDRSVSRVRVGWASGVSVCVVAGSRRWRADCIHAIRTDSFADFHFNSKMENLNFEIEINSPLSTRRIQHVISVLFLAWTQQ